MNLPGVFAQDVKLSYTVDQTSPEIYQVEISAQGTSLEVMSLKAVNLSLAFDLSCAHPTGYQTLLTDSWTTFLENALVSPGLELVHRAEVSSARWQFGSADPGLPATTTIDLPLAKEQALPIMKITFEGSCANDVYLESQKQNSLNQFADENMKLLDYVVVHPVQAAAFAFLSVEANAIDKNRTQIIWRAENEVHGSLFEIEKSSNQDFSGFTMISDKKASILGSQVHNYQYIEEGQMTSRSFYRLKYIDMDGNVEYSKTMKVEREQAAIQLQLQASVFPNPTSDYLNVLVEGRKDQTLQVRLTDLNGKELIQQEQRLDASGFTKMKIDLRKFPQAIYILEVSDVQHAEYPQSIRIVKK